MTTKPVTPQEKKLSTLRKILWISFIGIAVPAIFLLFGVIPMVWSSGVEDGFSTIALLISPFLLIGGLGVVCVVIYNIVKYRLEKDDDLFL
jgi:hypothetical protein